MEAAHSGECDDLAGLGRLHSTTRGCVLTQGHVRSIFVVVNDRVSDQLSCMSFVPDDDVIEALSPQGADDPFAVSIHPSNRIAVRISSMPIPATLRENSMPKTPSRSRIMKRGAVFREGVDDLLAEPMCVWVPRHGSADDLPGFEVQDDEDVERLEPDGLDREEIDADDAFSLVSQEDPPGLRSPPKGLRPDPLEVP